MLLLFVIIIFGLWDLCYIIIFYSLVSFPPDFYEDRFNDLVLRLFIKI